MRIGIDVRELDKREKTGIGRLILNFLKFVDKNDRQNQYFLFGNQHTRELNFGSSIKSRIIPEFSKIFWDQIVLLREINKEKLDIFFSPFYKGPILAQAKLIVTCHDFYFLEKSRNPISDWLRHFYCSRVWEKADIIIVDSQDSKERAVKFPGCFPQKVRVVYGNVDESFKPVDKSTAINSLLKKFPMLKKDIILYVGNLKKHKNIPGLIKAYSLLPEFLKDKFQLVIAGEKDKNYPHLLDLIKHFGLNNRIGFLGTVSEEDLLFLYNAASVLVLVSFWEGFGLPPLEAMACATPVVVSNTAALPEVVGEAGLYVNPQNAEDIAMKLEKMLVDERLRKDLSAKALIQSSKFKVEYSVDKILEIFRELCAH